MVLVAVGSAADPVPETEVVIEFEFEEPGTRAPVGSTRPEPVEVPKEGASDEMEVSTGFGWDDLAGDVVVDDDAARAT